MRSIQLFTALQTFLSESLEVNLQRAISIDLEAHLVDLFHAVVNSVPAYRQFLQVKGIDPASIQTLSAFQQLPLITKANYIKQYPLAEICRAGSL
jgi:phenylacetate-CoA ligase